MKRAKSNLIDQFLHHVDRGLISGTDDSSGPAALEGLSEALRAVLKGADANDALGVERNAGAAQKGYTVPLAIWIHDMRTRRQKWSVIEHTANEWLTRNGWPALSLARLKQLPVERASEIKQQRNLRALLKLVQTLEEKS